MKRVPLDVGLVLFKHHEELAESHTEAPKLSSHLRQRLVSDLSVMESYLIYSISLWVAITS